MRVSLKRLQRNAKGKEVKSRHLILKGSLSSAPRETWGGRGRLWKTSTAPAEPAGWEGQAHGIGGVEPGKANSADPSHQPGEEEECQGVF